MNLITRHRERREESAAGPRKEGGELRGNIVPGGSGNMRLHGVHTM